ncbi:unnamed protein product [Cuscuta europaea]|uniref:Aminotransferase-like plant mobile domain-containing protein n=1 Tax=Cuscuta europaea TaxID=41803 RepID=A0A9P0ZK74_CUSEU|nr:unnamed protein product [Cuscuta europaea]
MVIEKMKGTSRRTSVHPKGGAFTVGNFSTRFSLPSFAKRVNRLTEAQKEAVRRTGFGSLLLIPNQMICKSLLVELMERWNCDKSAFTLSHGEVTISLMDISLILGLRVMGKPVVVKDDIPFLDLEGEYGAALWNRKIAVASVEQRLESLGEADSEDFVRSFLLFMFGTLLFPNSNGKVDSRYLYLLRDVDKVDEFAWGAAVLEDLTYWLNKRKRENVQYVGGCLIFLQIWCYEHIDLARPGKIDNAVKYPRVCLWGSTKTHHRQWFIDKFKTLGDNQIIWSLELTPEESEVRIIKEFLEWERSGQSTVQQSSEEVSDIMDQYTAGIEMDSVTIISKETYAPSCIEILSEQAENRRSSSEIPSYISAAIVYSSLLDVYFFIKDGDDLERKNLFLEEQITELRKGMADLTRENGILNDRMSSCLQLEKHNEELRKEVDSLRQENRLLSSTTHTLLVRLEGILLDDDHNTDTVDNQSIGKVASIE